MTMSVFDDPLLLGIWGITVLACLAVLVYDLRKNNPFLGSLMKWVWGLTVLYSGPIGLALYAWSGRAQISEDTLPRRAARSVAHCYSGCGIGEICGIVLTAGVLALDTVWVAATTFTLAYVFGFALTVGPLMQEGMALSTALKDAFYAETASITVMEVAAISADIGLADDAGMGEPIFWFSLIISLSIGLAAAYPINVILIKLGVKEGMMNPRSMAQNE